MGVGQSDFRDAEEITLVTEVSLLRTCSIQLILVVMFCMY